MTPAWLFAVLMGLLTACPTPEAPLPVDSEPAPIAFYAGIGRRVQPTLTGLSADVRVLGLDESAESLVVSDFASAEGCPTVVSGYHQDLGFPRAILADIVDKALRPLVDGTSVHTPTQRDSCSVAYLELGQRRRGRSSRTIWILDSRHAAPRQLAWKPDVPMLRRRGAEGPLSTDPAALTTHGLILATQEHSQPAVYFSRISKGGESLWVHRVPGFDLSARIAGEVVVLSKTYLVDLRSGRRLGRLPYPVYDARTNGGEALAISDNGHEILVLRGRRLGSVARRIRVDAPVRLVAYA